MQKMTVTLTKTYILAVADDNRGSGFVHVPIVSPFAGMYPNFDLSSSFDVKVDVKDSSTSLQFNPSSYIDTFNVSRTNGVFDLVSTFKQTNSEGLQRRYTWRYEPTTWSVMFEFKANKEDIGKLLLFVVEYAL